MLPDTRGGARHCQSNFAKYMSCARVRRVPSARRAASVARGGACSEQVAPVRPTTAGATGEESRQLLIARFLDHAAPAMARRGRESAPPRALGCSVVCPFCAREHHGTPPEAQQEPMASGRKLYGCTAWRLVAIAASRSVNPEAAGSSPVEPAINQAVAAHLPRPGRSNVTKT